MNILSPDAIVMAAKDLGISKANYSLIKTLLLGFLGGAFIAMGGTLSVLVSGGMPALTAENPGLRMLLSGMTFPVGIILVVIAGAELFTSNNAVLMPGFWNKDFGLKKLLRNWTLVFIMNLVGAVCFAYLLVYLVGLFAQDPWHSTIIGMAEYKTSAPFWKVFVKGIGANWLVCLAIWMGLSATTTIGKIWGLWWPVMTFVALGYEHCVANMFYIPLGMMEGADVSLSDFLWGNLLPATLGNIVGGGLMVGTWYTSSFLKKY